MNEVNSWRASRTVPRCAGPPLLCLAAVALLAACAAPRPVEFINITFTPSVETDHYATWDFELEHCSETGDPRVNDAFLREHLLAELERELERMGYERKPAGDVDFLVSYQLEFFAPEDAGEVLQGAARGRIFVRDVATGRFVWRGERKARVAAEGTEEERIQRLRLFVEELLAYTSKLGAAE